MTDFHPHTIAELQSKINVWRDQLVGAEDEARYRQEQADKAHAEVETARQRIADYERLLAVAEPVTEPPALDAEEYVASLFDGCSDAQLAGDACANCGGDLTIAGVQSQSVIGGPLFVHADVALCVEAGAQ